LFQQVINKYISYLITLMIPILISGCSWVKVSEKVTPAPEVINRNHLNVHLFNPSDFLGSGLRNSLLGDVSVSCLSLVKKHLKGGNLQISMHRYRDLESLPSAPSVQYEKTKKFVNQSLEQLKGGANKSSPVSFLIIIALTDRVAQIDESNVRFTRDARRYISSNEEENFFKLCGTSYVNSVKFHSIARLWLSYYPENDEQRNRLLNIPAGDELLGMASIWRFKMFNNLYQNPTAAYILQYDGDDYFNPAEFTLQNVGSQRIDFLINQIANAVNHSSKGIVDDYHTRPWQGLLVANNTPFYRSENGTNMVYSSEIVFKQLQLLKQKVEYTRLVLKRVENQLINKTDHMKQANDCLAQASLSVRYGLLQFEACEQQVNQKNNGYFQSIEACRQSISATRSFKRSSCEILAQKLRIQNDILPLVLDQDIVVSGSENKSRIKPGDTFDSTGKSYSSKCISQSSINYNDVNSSEKIQMQYWYYPIEKQPIKSENSEKLFKLLAKSPEKLHQYFGQLTMTGYTGKVLPNFSLTKIAEKYYDENKAKFTALCGTHYVDQIKFKKGFSFNWMTDLKKNEKLVVNSFGLPERVKNAPWLYPQDMKGLVQEKEQLIGFLQQIKGGEPISYHLMPWKKYFDRRHLMSFYQRFR